MHNLLAHARHILSGEAEPQDLKYPVCILQNVLDYIMCLRSADRHSFRVAALIKCYNCGYHPYSWSNEESSIWLSVTLLCHSSLWWGDSYCITERTRRIQTFVGSTHSNSFPRFIRRHADINFPCVQNVRVVYIIVYAYISDVCSNKRRKRFVTSSNDSYEHVILQSATYYGNIRSTTVFH